MNSLTGMQLVASAGLQQGGGLAPPNITSNLASYTNIASVGNFSVIHSNAANAVGITSASISALQSIGANSFPHLFGQIPQEFSSQLGTGVLFNVTYARTANLFAGSNTANVFIQTLTQAQSHAVVAASVIGSAATAQWPNGVHSTVTGGFSDIGGNVASEFSTVANSFSNVGSLMIMNDALNGFSNAGCFNKILKDGHPEIGNLNITFYGKKLSDPVTGNVYTIGTDLFDYIENNPEGRTDDDPFKIAALNPLDSILGDMANNALTDTGDLDAVVSYFDVNGTSVNKWTDCLNIPLMLGSDATAIIEKSLGIEKLDVYEFINGILNHVRDVTSLNTIADVGIAMGKISPLPISNISAMTTPVSANDFSNITAVFGAGSGTNGNPTVNDILGSTNYNEALSSTVSGLQPLLSTPHYANISSDTANISAAITGGMGSGVTLSNGVTYTDINSLASAGSSLINNNASTLKALAPSLTNVASFSAFNSLAMTHNASMLIAPLAGLVPSTIKAMASDAMADLTKLSGLVGLIMSVVHKFHKPSMTVFHDFPPHPAISLALPGITLPASAASLAAFPSQLASMASLASAIPNADEITGMSLVTNCIDTASTAGQALAGTITEANNLQSLASSGISAATNAYSTNPISLAPKTLGTMTLGGI